MIPSYSKDLEGFLELGSVKFEYLEPKTLKEACALLAQHKGRAKVIAGGTQLIPLMRQGKIKAEYLVNLKNIANLEYITPYSDFAEEGVKIGALATLYNVGNSALVNERAGILVEAINQKELRINKSRWAYYMATIGGSLFTPESLADIAPALIILGAKAVMEGLQGWETVPVENLFTAAGENGEEYAILTEVRIPKQTASEIGLVYEKSGGIGAAVLLKLDAKHVNVEDFRVVVGGTGPVPVEAQEAATIMVGNPIDDYLVMDAAEAAANAVCDKLDLDLVEKTRDVIDEAIRHALDRAIGDFALGY